ncbi:MAG: hypothetical protein LBV68_05110 [Spirochaetaceae bacterium]|jgi:proteasome assembly chaperone (PAC2) family protein|nr:hypothetical protein [Spirochaetaceae bacterium]
MAWSERMKTIFDLGLQASKDLANAAGVKAVEIRGKAAEIGGKAGSTAADLVGAAGAKAVDLGAMASVKAQEISEKGSLIVEIKKLEWQTAQLTAELGCEVYRLFVEIDLPRIDRQAPEVKAILDKLSEMRDAIDQKEARIKEIGN